VYATENVRIACLHQIFFAHLLHQNAVFKLVKNSTQKCTRGGITGGLDWFVKVSIAIKPQWALSDPHPGMQFAVSHGPMIL
jgi:hypothetical protein